MTMLRRVRELHLRHHHRLALVSSRVVLLRAYKAMQSRAQMQAMLRYLLCMYALRLLQALSQRAVELPGLGLRVAAAACDAHRAVLRGLHQHPVRPGASSHVVMLSLSSQRLSSARAGGAGGGGKSTGRGIPRDKL